MIIINNDLIEETTNDIALATDVVFETLFKSHFKELHSYANTLVRDELVAEEIVQNLFFKLWEKKENLNIHTSLRAYLYRSTYNESLNYLRHQKVKLKYQQHSEYTMKDKADNLNQLEAKELERKLHSALNRLPEACRTIFQMSRFEDLKYREIADKLNISIKTVENQMGKALRTLRVELIDFLPLIFLFLI